VLLLAEGEAGAAREALIGAAEHAELPLVNYLAAARAAADAGDWAACDSLIDRAAGAAPGAALGARLEGVAIREQRGLIGECRATLEALRTDAPRHARVLQALAECYRSLGDWSALAGLVPELERHKAIGEDRARPFARAAALGRMGELGADALLAHWAGVPRRVQTDGEVVRAFANAARRAGVPDAAEEALRRAIEQRWDSELVELYGRLASAAPAPRRKHVDTWLAGHADDAALWLASGRIALSEHDWTKAREHFETSLKRAAGAPVYGELGRLCHALGERDRGAEYLLRCVELGGADLPALPMPQRGA
jgi:HemY protein